MPMGMSRFGFFDSCAAVDTASKPIYAKKITAAPRHTPDHPKCPKPPRFGGTNGCQFAFSSSGRVTSVYPPTPMNTSSTATFTTTMKLLKFADSLMPTISTVVANMMPRNATRLNAPCCCGSVAGSICASASLSCSAIFSNSQCPCHCTNVEPGTPASAGGSRIPKSCPRLSTYPLHPEHTVAAPNAYSSTRSQPMIHAKISPSVA